MIKSVAGVYFQKTSLGWSKLIIKIIFQGGLGDNEIQPIGMIYLIMGLLVSV